MSRVKSSEVRIESRNAPPDKSEPRVAQISSVGPPEELPGCQAVDGQQVDLRPHIWDATLKQYLLVDSGSQVTAVKPDPGDIPIPGKFLKAVNGSKIKCYGQKEIKVKIGRKGYPFLAIKADVDNTVLGWDFVRHHRLDLVWNEWGDQCIVDKKAKISKILQFRSLPYNKSKSHKNLAVLEDCEMEKSLEALSLLHQIAALESLSDDEESIDSLIDSPYKDLLAKFPDLLKLKFRVPENCEKDSF